jgi:hypothetical protein
MFQPFNESFVQSTVESTIDRHSGEDEEARALREGESFQPSWFGIEFCNVVHALGHALLKWGTRLEQTGASHPPMIQQHGSSH